VSDIESIMRAGPIIAVLTLDDPSQARALAQTYVEAGIAGLEVTLRTPRALEVMARMAEVDGAVVGAGTVLNRDHLKAAVDHGAQFIVSPGLTSPVAEAAASANVAYLPGIANSGDIMRGLDLGLSHFKFFPAEASGGVKALSALAAPFAACRFCPTGGVNPDNLRTWLDTPGVLCAGGTWLNPKPGEDLATLGERVASAVKLARGR